MAKFVIKGKKGAGTITREVNGIVIGARSSCTLSLEDPLVAERHCEILNAPEGFCVHDCGTSTGTFLNGVEVKGSTPIPDGAEIVIGVSRLLCTVNAVAGELTLTLKEQDFRYDKKNDPLKWSRAELAFGKFAPLRLGNLVALGLLLIFVPLALVGTTSERLADPGPLDGGHSGAAFARARELHGGTASGCEVCHAAFQQPPADRCGVCHPDVLESARTTLARGNGTLTTCTGCHIDHRGGIPGALRGPPATAEMFRGWYGDVGTDPATIRAAHKIEIATQAIPFSFNTFSHAEHVKKSGLACAQCHRPAATATLPTATSPRREFTPVTFQSCMGCHDPKAEDAVRSKTTFQVTWHGSHDPKKGDTACVECHATTHSKELASSSTMDAEVIFDIPKPRAHADMARAHAGDGKSDCATCHKSGVEPKAGLTGQPFRHGTHLTSTVPDGAVTAAAITAECRACHTEQEGARALSTAHYGGAGGDCALCHREDRATPRPPTVAAMQPAGKARARTVFPHAPHVTALAGRHQDLKDGCLACHEPRSGPSGAFDAKVFTDPKKSATCTPCHETHKDIGGGDCAKCHLPGDGSYAGKGPTKSWPVGSGFQHRSRGHVADTDGGRCDVCHEGVGDATDVAMIRIPIESDASCTRCHVVEHGRFHWR